MPKIVDKEAVRAKIIDAALITYADGGVYGASLEKVAIAAGIGKGTLYYYFNSKEELAFAIVERYFDSLETELESLANSSSFDTFVEILGQFVNRSERDNQTVRVLMDVFSPGFDSGRALRRARDFFDHASATLEHSLTALLDLGEFPHSFDPANLARTLTALLDGIGLHAALLDIPAGDRAAMAKTLLLVLRRGFSR